MENSKSSIVRPNSDIDINSVTIGVNHPSFYDYLPLLFFNLILQTAFIPNTKILSSLLVAHAGLGKTIKLEVLRSFDFVKYTMDITPKLLADFLDDVERGRYKFLVIPDFIATLGHSHRTTELARSMFRGMMEEGITSVDIFGMKREYRDKVKAGLISGITPEYYKDNTRVWKSDGFLQRFLPFSYSHSNETRIRVMNNIRDKIDTIRSFKMQVKTTNVIEPVITEDIDNIIRLVSMGLIEPKEPPYRVYQQIIALCKANAVLRDSDKVEKQDTDLVMKLSNYMNRKEALI